MKPPAASGKKLLRLGFAIFGRSSRSTGGFLCVCVCLLVVYSRDQLQGLSP